MKASSEKLATWVFSHPLEEHADEEHIHMVCIREGVYAAVFDERIIVSASEHFVSLYVTTQAASVVPILKGMVIDRKQDYRLLPGENDKLGNPKLKASLDKNYKDSQTGVAYTLWERIVRGHYYDVLEQSIDNKVVYGLLSFGVANEYTVVPKVVFNYFKDIQTDPMLRRFTHYEKICFMLTDELSAEEQALNMSAAAICLQGIWEASGFSTKSDLLSDFR